VGFTAPGLLIIPGINDEADANSLDEEFSKFKGVDGEKSGDIIIQYLADLSPGQTSQQAKFIEFKKNNDGNWMDLHTQSELSIITRNTIGFGHLLLIPERKQVLIQTAF